MVKYDWSCILTSKGACMLALDPEDEFDWANVADILSEVDWNQPTNFNGYQPLITLTILPNWKYFV